MGRIRATALTIVTAALSLGLASPAVAAASNASVAGGNEWPQFMGSFTHAAASQAVGPSSPANSWTLPPKRGYYDEANSPVVGSDGTVYVVQKKAAHRASALLRAISPTTHKALWSWSGAGPALGAVPAIAPDGTVYLLLERSGLPGWLYAIKRGGTTLWKDPVSDFGGTYECGCGPPTLGPDGTVYLQNADSEVYALNPKNGHVYWSFAGSLGDVQKGDMPAISPDGATLYLTSNGGDLYALSAGPTGGQVQWTYQIQAQPGATFFNAPSVGPNGTIYLTTGESDVFQSSDIDAVNPNGTLKWVYVASGTFESTPAVTAAGQVVAANNAGILALQQSDGMLAWSYSASAVFSSAASDADGNIYIQDESSVFALSSEGSLLWTATDPSTLSYVGSPALDDSGTLYVNGSLDKGAPDGPSLIAYGSSG
jgi:outer membrane protein assembly factor BamB